MKVQLSRPPIPPLAAIFFGILAVSTASVFIRFAQESAPSLIIAAYRLALATIFLIPAAIGPGKTDLKKLNHKQLGLAIISGIFLAFHFATWISSLAHTTVASSVVLVDTSPLWVALLSPLLLKEKIGRLVLAGLVVTLLGGIFIGFSDVCQITAGWIACPSFSSIVDGKFFMGDGLALLGAVFAAGYLLIGRELRPKMTLVSYTFLVYGIAAPVLICMAAFGHLQPFGYPPYHLSLVPGPGHHPTAYRPFDLQLEPALPVSRFCVHHNFRGINRIHHPGVFHLGRDSDGIKNCGRSPHPDRNCNGFKIRLAFYDRQTAVKVIYLADTFG